MKNNKWFKNKESDIIWWLKSDRRGEHLFSFDKQKIYNLFADYPMKLTPNEREIFARENPEWRDFFADRFEK